MLLQADALSLRSRDTPSPLLYPLSLSLSPTEVKVLVCQQENTLSLLVHTLLGLLPPSFVAEGKVRYQGYNLLALSEREGAQVRGKGIAFIPLFSPHVLPPHYTIFHLLHTLLARHTSLRREERDAEIFAALKETEIFDPSLLLPLTPSQLSLETLQRVLLARALLLDPQILLLEGPKVPPEGGVMAEIASLFQRIQQRRKKALLLLTSDLSLVPLWNPDEVSILYRGALIEEGKGRDLSLHPMHPYSQKLLKAYREGAAPSRAWIEGEPPAQGCPFQTECPYLMPLCTTEAPPLFPLPTQEHHSRCWLFDKELEWKIDYEKDITS